MNLNNAQRTIIRLVIISFMLFGFSRAASSQEEDQKIFISWKPDGVMLAVTSHNTLEIIDAASSQPLNTITGLSEQVTAASWSPNGEQLAVANGKTVDIWREVWNSNSAQIVSSLTYTIGYVYSVAWSPDGSKIAVANGIGDIWELTNPPHILYSLTDHLRAITQFAWSPDSALIASASVDRSVKIWNVLDGELVNSMIVATNLPPPDDRAAVFSLDWNPDGTKLVFGAEDGTVRIWDRAILSNRYVVSEANDPGVFEEHEQEVLSVAWSSDGQHIASGSQDGTIRIWDVEAQQQIQLLQIGDSVDSVAFSPDGTQLAYGVVGGDGRDAEMKIISLSDILDPTSIYTLAHTTQIDTHPVVSIDWNNDGTRIAAGHHSGLVEIIDSSTGQLSRIFQLPSVIEVAWSTYDSDLLAVSAAELDGPGTIYILNTATGQEILTVTGGDLIYSISWKPDGTRIAGAIGYTANPPASRYVTIWDTVSGQTVSDIPFKNEDIYSLDWSPDDSRIAGGAGDNNIMVWDANTGEVLNTLIGHTSAISSVAWSPDSNKLASASSVYDQTIQIWDATTSKNLFIIPSGALSIAWNPDGTRIATANLDPEILIWDAATGHLVDTIPQADDVEVVAWSPLDNMLAIGYISGKIQIVPLSQSMPPP